MHKISIYFPDVKVLKCLHFDIVVLHNVLTHSKAETYFEMLFCPTIINQQLGIVTEGI